jgi:hypothetical protein
MTRSSRPLAVLVLAALATLSACGSDSAHAPSTPPPTTGTGQGVKIDVAPKEAETSPGGTVAFAASVTGTIETGVAWEVVEAGGGAVDATGVYTAPSAAGTFHVRVTSRADAQRQATATVTVTAPPPPPPPPPPAVTVTVAPASGSALACQTLRLSATVTNATDTSVTWSVQEGTAGGTVSADGVYTAPASAGTYHVVATSRADTTKRAIATVAVTEKVLSVAVSPATTTVTAGGTAQFSATVTTTCGSFTSVQTLTAPELSAN